MLEGLRAELRLPLIVKLTRFRESPFVLQGIRQTQGVVPIPFGVGPFPTEVARSPFPQMGQHTPSRPLQQDLWI